MKLIKITPANSGLAFHRLRKALDGKPITYNYTYREAKCRKPLLSK